MELPTFAEGDRGGSAFFGHVGSGIGYQTGSRRRLYRYLLSDPGDVEVEVQTIQWRLFQVDDNIEPIEVLALLHESVLDTEPGGREMMPRDSSA